jgi:hypothetical protein
MTAGAERPAGDEHEHLPFDTRLHIALTEIGATHDVVAAAQGAYFHKIYRESGAGFGWGDEGYRPKYRPGWAEQDLLDHAAVPLEPPSICGMLYPRQRHILSSEPGHGKTWLGLYAAAEVMKDGKPVVWINTDDAPEAEIRERLNLLGVDDGRIAGLFHYFRPDRKARIPDDCTQLPEIAALAREHRPTLAVVDSFNPTLGLQGLNYLDETEVEQGWQTFARPFTDVGAAFLALDHLTKATDGRGRYSVGSQRKLAGCSVHIGMKPITSFSRGLVGRVGLIVHKVRSGFLGGQGHTFGDFVLNAETGMFTAGIEDSKSENAAGDFRPTVLMERVSRVLEDAYPHGMSANALQENVRGGRAKTIREAAAYLAEDRYAERKPKGAGFQYVSVKPYREREGFWEETA